jgi:hypothetical protein
MPPPTAFVEFHQSSKSCSACCDQAGWDFGEPGRLQLGPFRRPFSAGVIIFVRSGVKEMGEETPKLGWRSRLV